MPTIQNGEIVIIKPARPLGIAVSAYTRAPLPIPRTKNPLKQAAASSLPRGTYKLRALANASIIAPESVYRMLTSASGGNVSSAMRMVRYVVPQKKHTAAKAR